MDSSTNARLFGEMMDQLTKAILLDGCPVYDVEHNAPTKPERRFLSSERQFLDDFCDKDWKGEARD